MPADGPTGLKLTINLKNLKRSRPLPEGNHDDLHKSEQMSDQFTTVMAKKRKKKHLQLQRTVDKENPSESDLTSIKTKTASDLFYSCNIDKVSEAQIVDAVERINYSIDNLISNILDEVKKSKLSYHKKPSLRNPIPTKPDSDMDITLWSLLIDSRLSDHTRDLVLDAVLHNLISTLIHKHFFKGGHFFGVGSKSLHGYLETMLSKLVAGENSDPIAVQRWRSMSVEAVFQMNGGVDSQLNDQLIAELECMLKAAFSPPPGASRLKKFKSRCESIVRGEQQSLSDIVRQARKLSFTIQNEVVSCQLLVTIVDPASGTQTSSDGTSADDVLGTYAFGLQRILGSEHISILIPPRMITRSILL